MMDYKKYFSDTLVQTTHLLKKCVLQPRKVLKKEAEAKSSFKRGAMEFEDFNYTMFN